MCIKRDEWQEVPIFSDIWLDADSMNVLATLLVVGSMDDACSDIIENGNIKQSFVEKLSQVRQQSCRSLLTYNVILRADVIQDMLANLLKMVATLLHVEAKSLPRLSSLFVSLQPIIMSLS